MISEFISSASFDSRLAKRPRDGGRGGVGALANPAPPPNVLQSDVEVEIEDDFYQSGLVAQFLGGDSLDRILSVQIR
jgi:hypothetical protein